MKKIKPVTIKPPSRKERIYLRWMIFIGVISVGFFLHNMLRRENVSSPLMYVLLMITLVYYCLKYLHEWYHYFSISADPKPAGTRTYTVDILTTYCAGEPFDMLEKTLTAIQNITYPHTAWCCDEADDPLVKALCSKLNVRHVTRVKKINAKAGNINNALQYATGELCLVLDPDHIPVPGLLDEVVAYFDDPSIGFVQIVQAYYNQGESMVAKGAAQQTYQFYGPMMMAMHKYGTVQAIGANCTFRRAALDSIGGHAAGLAEDMHTAMQLHAKGWRSIYVPAILTRGLVPATMSSYYKQQLKWSRGTWELLVATFPKLYRKFTWRQKIHYLTLPFHYLSGVIFFLNFLIPVLFLFTGRIPLQMDVLDFLLTALPVFFMSVFIRHNVQKWVAEETERGFHIVGGILQIGTWWIHTLGFIYTLLRKKVPYIPTPKNDEDRLPLVVMIPNILIAAVSLVAIIYGLYFDYNPYTFFMVLLASMQVLFMLFIIGISGYLDKKSMVKRFGRKLRRKDSFIIYSHGFLRKYSLPLSFVLIGFFIVGFIQQQRLSSFLTSPLEGLNMFYSGLYVPRDEKLRPGTIRMAANRKDISILAVDVPWDATGANQLATATLENIYRTNAIPLLAWDPARQIKGVATDTGVFRQIASGTYDPMILSLARQVVALNKPLFLQCCYGTDPKKISLFAPVANQGADFINAWRHMHELFKNAGADKVIWVWNPWNPHTVAEFYPGNNYVDWIGIDINADSTTGFPNDTESFDSLYRPYHRAAPVKAGLPVLVTCYDNHQLPDAQWWKAAWKGIDTAFTEIKSVVISTPVKDLRPGLTSSAVSDILEKSPHAIMPVTHYMAVATPALKSRPRPGIADTMKGVLYDKGYHWFRNKHTMGLKTLRSDINAMKSVGINTIERTMPGFYDDNLGTILQEKNVSLIPRFSVLEENADVIVSDREMASQKKKLLELVKENLDKKYIVAWSLGNDGLYTILNRTLKPDYFYYRQRYVTWLAEVCEEINKLDGTRPILLHLQWDEGGQGRWEYYRLHVPQITNYLLTADPEYKEGLKTKLQPGMTWGYVPVTMWPLLPAIAKSGFIPQWQDIENTNSICLNGLFDLDGRTKETCGMVASIWNSEALKPFPIPEIKILKPSQITHESAALTYYILSKTEADLWQLDKGDSDIQFDWYLAKLDQYGNILFIKKQGEGPSLELTMPHDPQLYKLYVEAVHGTKTRMVNSTLNTPLE